MEKTILALSIKRKFFDEILAGTKTVETRTIWANSLKKYAQIETKDGRILDEMPTEEIEYMYKPKQYTHLKLITGAYNIKPRPYIIVEVKDAEIFFMQENGETVTYEYDDGKVYALAEIDYHLGAIVEKHL